MGTDNHLLEDIAANAVFAGLAEELIAELAAAGEAMVFDAGDYLLRESQSADRFFLIRNGSVHIEAAAGDFGPFIIDTLSDNDLLGWSWLIPPYEYQFDAIAAAPTSTWRFDAERLREAVSQRPDLGFALLQRIVGVVSQRLRAARLQIIDVYA